MEDEEEINTNNNDGYQQRPRIDAGEGGLGMDETPTPVEQPEVVSNDNITEQCEFFSDPLPEFDDPVESLVNEASMVRAEMEIQVEDMLDPEMGDFSSPMCVDDVEAENGEGVGDDVGDTSALELVDSLIVTDKSRKDGELAAAEHVHVEVAAERIVVCGSSRVVAEGEVSRDDSQLAGLDLPDLSKDDEAGTEKEASSPLLEEGVEDAGSDGGIADNENLLEIQNVVGAQSSVKEDHYEEEGKQEGTEDTDLDTQTELVNEVQVEKNSSPQVDDSNDADSLMGPRDDDDGEVVAEDVPIGDTEVETETDGTEMADAGDGSGGGGKRKRGKISKVPARSPARKVTEEDVCFICFDGGELVLCDRRGCPKAYHPSCVNRDEAFFRAKGRWNCGWHLCSTCEKNAHYMCYTCTFSLCKACIKDAVILCVKGNKGFCETCMKTVMEIENKEQANKEGGVDYDDKSSWMYLFKDYWMDLKASLSLSVDDLAQARNPWKRSDVLVGKQELAEDVLDTIHDDGSGSDSSENLKVIKPKRRNSKKRAKTIAKEDDLPGSATKRGAEGTSGSGRTEWASKELLEFVSHMKNGDKSVLSQFDVQALLLEYIKTNKLRDPRKKSQIVCDARLQNIFAKPRVGHFEMLKLLESHFLVKDDSQIDDVQGTAVDTEVNQLEADGTNDAPVKGGKERRRKTRRKNSERGRPSNLDDYAAIDVHNISLIYLRRKLFEDLLDDLEKSCDKVIGTFVRIRISGSNQKQDIYRLVQIAGTSRAAEPYKVGKKTTDIVLEILNLNKTEVVSIDTISNQEFTEDECKRLRQSIKCGLINCPTVGDVLDKAQELQEVRVKDWLDSETVRLSHLRDRASEKGRKKELRECVEKLQLLKTQDERQRRLEEIPEIHADPKMDPSYESEEADSETEDNKQEFFSRPRGSSFGRKGREPVSPRGGNFHSTDSYSGSRRNSFKNWDSNKFISSQEPSKSAEANLVGDYAENQVRDRDIQETTNMEKINVTTNTENVGHGSYGFTKSGSSSEVLHAFPSSGVVEDTTAVKVNESEKMWHYKDPSGKVQGPFSIVQLRKWNNTGYFPADLKIWKATEKEDESLLLIDALAGRFHKKLPQTDTNMTSTRTVQSPHASSAHGERPYRSALQQGSEGEGEAPKFSAADGRGSEYSRNDQINLPSPTPKLSTPDASGGGQFSRASASVSVNQSGSKEHTTTMGGSPSPAPSSQIVSSFSPLQNSQTNATGESQGWGSGSAAQRQEVVANHLHSMPAVQQQQAGYNQWGGNIQSPGQNHIGNFANPGFPAMPQSEPWRPPVAVNQPNLSWGVSVPGANAYTAAPGPRPENANMFWNPMQGNPNMGWGAPGTTNMNWMAASVPGQVPGWVAAAPTANPVGMVNPGWVPQAGHPGTVLPGHQPPPVSGNPAWGPSPNGNPGSQVNVNPVWGPPVGNQGGVGNNQGPAPGNAIPSWSGPAGSWGNDNQQQQGGGNDFGNHGGRQWNRDSNGGGNGQRGNWGWCRYEKAGTCRKGKHCRNRHT